VPPAGRRPLPAVHAVPAGGSRLTQLRCRALTRPARSGSVQQVDDPGGAQAAPAGRSQQPWRAAWAVLARLGPRTVAWVGVNSVRRLLTLRRERRRRVVPPLSAGQPPGRLRTVDVDGRVVRATFDDGRLELSFLTEDTVVVTWATAAPPSPYVLVGELARRDPLVPTLQPPAPPRAGPTLPGGWWTATAGGLQVQIGPGGTLRYRSADGAVLRTDGPPRRQGTAWVVPFDLRAGELVSGFGLQATPVDRRGQRLQLWNSDPGGSWGPGAGPLYLNVPVQLGMHPSGDLLTLYDTTARLVVDLGSAGGGSSGWVAAPDGPLRQVVVSGPLPHLLHRFSQLTGRPALPPRWALGYHHSRWGYRTATEVEAVADGFAAEGVPLSVVHLDIDHLDGYRVLTVDRRRFPDLAGLAARLGRQGTRLVTIVDPAVKADRRFDLYRQGRRRRLLCTTGTGRVVHGVVWPGRAAFPDFSDPEARRWWADRCRVLFDAGVGGLWHDMNEPTSLALAADPTLPLATRHQVEGRGGDHAEVHNVYGVLMDEAGHLGARQARPDRRPFVLSRAGWAGVQRSAWHWTGDAETSWASLAQQVASLVGLGLSGVPFVGCDIGGFSGAPDPELYLRWLQLGVFLPLCRTHCVVGVPGREPWRWPPPVRAAVGAWIRFRYRLLPTLTTLAHQAAATGLPLVRPWWWPVLEPADGPERRRPAVATAPDGAEASSFLLGDHLLVTPVVVPGARQVPVPVPPGCWTSLWGDGGPWVGPPPSAGRVATTVHRPAPLERPPVLVRQGAILALDDGWVVDGDACRIAGEPGGEPAGVAPTDAARAGRSSAGEGRGGGRGSGGPEAPARQALAARAHRGPDVSDRGADLSPEAAVAADHAPRRLAFHCWPAADEDQSAGSPAPGPDDVGWCWAGRPAGASPGGWAVGGAVDDAGDGAGPVRHDHLELTGVAEGGRAVCRWVCKGSFAPPDVVRVVVHGWSARRAWADGRPVPVVGSAVTCEGFSELVLDGLLRRPNGAG